jgi:glycosyltransferase involved in cell wall biosynthesis
MPHSSLVSIIIPAFNATRWLQDTVASVQEQSFQEWELILVDDGSTDDTASVMHQLAATDSRIRVVQQANAGHCAARNTGFFESKESSPYVIFLDADDLWEVNTLEILVTLLNQHPHACGAYGSSRYINQRGQFYRQGELESYHRDRYQVGKSGALETVAPHDPTTFRVVSIYAPMVSVGSVLLRRDDVAKKGLFDVRLNGYEDWDHWTRLVQDSYLAWSDKPVLRYRQHDGNMSKDGHRLGLEEREVRKKLLQIFPVTTPDGRIMRLGAWYHRLINLRRYLANAKANFFAGKIHSAAFDILRSIKQLWLGLIRV